MYDTKVRDGILEAAASLFQRLGYAAVSLRMIATEADVTTGGLYYYFKDKDEIVHVILDTGHRRIIAEVSSAIAELGPQADRTTKIRVGIRAHLAALFEKDSFPAANVRIYAHVPNRVRTMVRSGRKEYEVLWNNVLTGRGVDERGADSQHMTMFLLGAANWCMEWYRANNDSLDDIAADLAATFGSVLPVR